MVPLARILVLFTISASAVFSEVLEIRTIKSSREISTTIKNNLDDGKLPDDRFEAGYSKLVSDRKIEELSRFLKNDMTSGSQIALETTAKDRWQSSIELEPNFNQTCCQMWCIVSTIAPGGKDPYQSPAISFNANATLPFNRWQVLGGMTFGAEEILTLIKIGKSDVQAFPPDVPLLTFEGYLFLMD
ncbi:MAG TPA: hypothetical protein VM511_06910, partial [Luteolibacter sp.]|nr:hypothetical protein [Luteolibacter sp.]